MEIIWSPLSLLDIEEIGNFIAEDNPSRAGSFIDELITSVEKLTDFPESGKMCNENPIFRELIHEKYRLIYQIRSKNILIITVLSPGRSSSHL